MIGRERDDREREMGWCVNILSAYQIFFSFNYSLKEKKKIIKWAARIDV